MIRMTALLATMTQMGSYVPASSCVISPFDAIYCRIGATDSITTGLSTFMTELTETSTILRDATSRSLVILDELGRGTSTHDGTAVAHATLEYLLHETGCATLFVTHYLAIALHFNQLTNNIGAYYMDYLETESPEGTKQVVFLYKLTQGIAQRSYGLNVARLAGISEDIVERAQLVSHEMELLGRMDGDLKDKLTMLLKSTNGADAAQLVLKIQAKEARTSKL